MAEGRARSWFIGTVSLLIALILVLSTFSSYVSLQYILASKGEGDYSLTFGSGTRDDRALLTVRVKVVNLEPRIEVPIPNALVIIEMLKEHPSQANATIIGHTGSRGTITFKLPPGNYIVGSSYLGMGGNVTVSVSSEKSWVLAEWSFYKANAKSFTLQLYDWDDTGIIIPGQFVSAHADVSRIEKPMIAEVYASSRQGTTSSEILNPQKRMALMRILEYDQRGESMWLSLTPNNELPLREFSPAANLFMALYSMRVEVIDLA